MKKKNTRDYGKSKFYDPEFGRVPFKTGGFVDEDQFGDPMIKHVNQMGGITDGPDPNEEPLTKPGRVTPVRCDSEYSTFRMATREEMAASTGYPDPKAGKKEKPPAPPHIPSGGGGGGGKQQGPVSSGAPRDTGSTEAPDPAVSTDPIDLSMEPEPREGTEDI